MRFRLLLVLLLLLTTACTKKEESAAKPDSKSESAAVKTGPTPAEIAAAKEKAEAEAELAEAARIKAESEAAAKRLADATEKYQALNEELNTEMKAYSLARQKVKNREEAEKLAQENPMIKFGPQFIEFAKEYVGTDEAKEALSMMALRGSGESKTEAVDAMINDYVDDDSMVQLVSGMSRGMPTPQNEKWIDKILEHTTNPTIKGNALVAKAGMLDGIANFKGVFASATKQQLATVDKETIEFVNTERDASEREELIGLMESFVNDYSAEAKIVERELFGLKYLSVGCEAPDIAGIDLDDKEFKLTDYRGKVVLLDFWGDW